MLCRLNIEHIVRNERLVTATTRWPDRKREKEVQGRRKIQLFLMTMIFSFLKLV